MPEMNAVRIHGYGGPEVLVYETAPRPLPAAGQVLVHIHAAGVNPIDWKVRRGDMQQFRPAQFPLILGYDIAGIVEEVGNDASGLSVGDAVYANIPGGGYAEYAAIPAQAAARKPRSLDFQQSAALPVAALTAWQALFDHAGLSAGQTVLIHAGAGGVGHLAIQFAKNAGARVLATASARNQSFLRDMGADIAIDYTSVKFEDAAHDIDVVFDTIGGDTQERSWGVLKPGGVLVSITSPQTAEAGEAHQRRGIFFPAQPSREELTAIAGLFDAGKMRVDVGKVLPLTQARQAHELSESGHTRGKIVLQTA